MEYQEFTADQINRFIDRFTPVYVDGKETNPVPNDRRVTVWCDHEDSDYCGFACDTTGNEMGINILIAKCWIYEDELKQLIANHPNV